MLECMSCHRHPADKLVTDTLLRPPMQVDYVLGASGRSWLIGFGSDYPQFVWHKLSYNAYIDWPTRGRSQWMGEDRGPWTVDGGKPVIVELAKLDIEGSRTHQRFIAYGALFAAPLRDDSLVVGRKDFTKAVCPLRD